MLIESMRAAWVRLPRCAARRPGCVALNLGESEKLAVAAGGQGGSGGRSGAGRALKGRHAQVNRLEHAAFITKDDRPFEDILQLPDVSRPTVVHEQAHAGRAKPVDIDAVLARKALAELLGQDRDVFLPLPQRHDQDGHDIAGSRGPAGIPLRSTLSLRDGGWWWQ